MSELDRSTRVESMEGSGGSWFDRRFYSEFRLSLLLCVVALLAFISLFEGSSEPAVLFDGSGGLQPNSLAPELLPSTSIHQDIREIPRDTKLRDTAFHLLTDPQHLRVPGQASSHRPPPIPTISRRVIEAQQKAAIEKEQQAHAKEIPQDAWLRVAAFDFLTGSGPKSKTPPAAASAAQTSSSHTARAPTSLASGSSHAVTAGSTTTPAAARAPNALSHVATSHPAPAPPSPPATTAANPRAAGAHVPSSQTHGAKKSKDAGGLPSYVPAPQMGAGGGVTRAGGGGTGGVPEDRMGLSFLKSDQKKLQDVQMGKPVPSHWNGGVPRDSRLREMAWNDLTSGAKTVQGRGGGGGSAGAGGEGGREGGGGGGEAAMPVPPWRKAEIAARGGAGPARARAGGEHVIPSAEGGREGAKDVSWKEWEDAGGKLQHVGGVFKGVNPKRLDYRGLPKDSRLRAMAWSYMNGEGGRGAKAGVEGAVKAAGRQRGDVKGQEARQLATELHDQALLKAAASLAHRQEEDLAQKIQRAEERLKLISGRRRGGGRRRGEEREDREVEEGRERRERREERERDEEARSWLGREWRGRRGRVEGRGEGPAGERGERGRGGGHGGRGREGGERGGWGSVSRAITDDSSLLKRTLSHAEIMTGAEEHLRRMEEERHEGDREERARRRGEEEERARMREEERRRELEHTGKLGQLTRKVKSMQRRLEQIKGIRADDEALWRHGMWAA